MARSGGRSRTGGLLIAAFAGWVALAALGAAAARADITGQSGTSFGAVVGQPFTVKVARFSSTTSDLANFTALVAWGDGSSSEGTVTVCAACERYGYDVSGGHTYLSGGAYAVTVTIRSIRDGAMATAHSGADVSPRPGSGPSPPPATVGPQPPGSPPALGPQPVFDARPSAAMRKACSAARLPSRSAVIGGLTFNRILGTERKDVLTGTDGNDIIIGRGGADTIDGRGGRDIICGGEGGDTIAGGAGSDVLDGDATPGRSMMSAAAKRAASWDDRIAGGTGHDVLLGGAGADRLAGDDGDDEVRGGAGDDRMWGDIPITKAAVAASVSADGTLYTGPGFGSGADALHGGSGNDALDGGDGGDRLWGDSGHDTIRGDPDWLRVDNPAHGPCGKHGFPPQCYVDYAAVRGSGEDELHGGSGNDSLLGGLLGDAMFGDSGNDRLDAGTGTAESAGRDDRLYGGPGDDVLEGGDYDGPLSASREWSPPQNGPVGIDGGPGDDRIVGTSRGDTITGGTGRDRIDGGGGDDELRGGGGNDVVRGGDGADAVYGDGGSDRLTGDDGADRLRGGTGNDRASGGAGNDDVYGDGGADTLKGGVGHDRLLAGAGDDVVDAWDDPDHEQLDGDKDVKLFADWVSGGLGTDLCHVNPAGDGPIAGCESIKKKPL